MLYVIILSKEYYFVHTSISRHTISDTNKRERTHGEPLSLGRTSLCQSCSPKTEEGALHCHESRTMYGMTSIFQGQCQYEQLYNETRMGRYLERLEGGVLDSFFSSHSVSNCLDLGCGSGRFSLLLDRKGVEVFAFDHDINPLEILKEKITSDLVNKVHIILGDGSNTCFESEKFDSIIAVQSISCLDLDLF